MAKKLTGKAKCGLENLDALMLPYQAAWVRDRSRIKLVEKSRQIGFRGDRLRPCAPGRA